MISPDEIKAYAEKWWKPFLQSILLKEQFFPRSIERIGKIKSGQITERFDVLQKEVEVLYRYSKSQTGTGYKVVTAEKNFRRTGSHELPDNILFETADDYIAFVGKKKEWKHFQVNLEKIKISLPELEPWMVNNCQYLTSDKINWEDILRVCHYFISTPRPALYLRQLPVQIHTKFIEDNAALIQSLLDFLIPDHIRDFSQKRFAERYFLKYDEPLIRLRFLDKQLCDSRGLSDISIPLSDFEKLEVSTRNILITENKMNFLTLPAFTSTIAVWSGGGFNVSYLKNITWLSAKRIVYWGDIDEHGFQILNQLRSYYPTAQSTMMDMATYKEFEAFAGTGFRNKTENLSLLTPEENDVFKLLKMSAAKNRLEQEKIPQWYVDRCLEKVLEG